MELYATVIGRYLLLDHDFISSKLILDRQVGMTKSGEISRVIIHFLKGFVFEEF